MADVGVTVVGAGVVGLAIAARLAENHPGLVLLERRERPGQETSSRNSEVIHAGLYYPTGSLKARLCVDGNHRLYEFCERHGVPCRRVGKLVVARAEGEIPEIERLLALARANGTAVEPRTAGECRALEPSVRAVFGLLSPDTGIVSAHGLMDALLALARTRGIVLQTRSELVGLERAAGAYRLTVRTPAGEESFTSETVVNAAGLGADTVAGLAGIDCDAAAYRLHWWKGSYFSLRPGLAGLVSRLVYPVPNQVSLGVHVVLGLDGRVRFGPDFEHLPDRRMDYAVDPKKREAFGEAARRLLPDVADADLEPDTAGIRPKLQIPGQAFRDFIIAEESGRGLPGLVNLVGIESPGLTACLAIAERVAELL